MMDAAHMHLERQLNDPDPNRRLDALLQLTERTDTQTRSPQDAFENVNNHIHTIYSFSPYSPACAVYRARQAGLSTAGLMDHDSISGAREFVSAGRIARMPVTVGIEIRVRMDGTPLAGRRINNPDQNGVAYIALHGIAHNRFDALDAFLAPRREARNRRNRAMTARLDARFSPLGISLDFEADILPLSQYARGGSVTERHLLYALSQKLLARFDAGDALLSFLENEGGIPLPEKTRGLLADPSNPHIAYDLLGLLKAQLVSSFYIDADEECPGVQETLTFAEEIGAVSAYAYLGDVGGASITGDKRAQRFEDAYLDELFDILVSLGFRAVTYMPSRNTPAQLSRVRTLCDGHGLFQISGEDINSPRQPFICEAQKNEAYQNLTEAAWALIGHELAVTEKRSLGMFSPQTAVLYPSLPARTAFFAALGRELAPDTWR